MSRLKIKVCGIKDPGNMRDLALLKPDRFGFIFYKDSPRCVLGSIEPESILELPEEIERVGVFVNSTLDQIRSIVAEFSLNAVQFHGEESPELCKEARSILSGVRIVKAISVSSKEDLLRVPGYKGCVSEILFDTKTELRGGSGKSFDWSLLKAPIEIPFFVAGGINQENIEELLSLNNPYFIGIDINSGVEVSPGFKSLDKVRTVIERVRRAE